MERLRNMQRAQRIAHLETGEPDRVHDVVADLVAHGTPPEWNELVAGFTSEYGRLTTATRRRGPLWYQGPSRPTRDLAVLALLAAAPPGTVPATMRDQVRQVDLSGAADLTPLCALPELAEVSLKLCRRLTGLAELVAAGRLTSLRLDEVAVGELDLTAATRLERLDVGRSVGPVILRGLPPSLRRLGLWDLPEGTVVDTSRASGVQELWVRRAPRPEPLAPLRGLRDLTIERPDAAWLAALPDLERLSGHGLASTAPLGSARALRYLHLDGAPAGMTFTPLDAPELTELVIRNIGTTASLDGLDGSSLAGVRELSIRHCADLAALRGLSGLTGMTRVDILDVDRLTDLGAAAAWTHLEELRISASELTDVSPLAGLTRLRVLDLSGCRRLKDLTPLAGLTLERLVVSDTRVTHATVPRSLHPVVHPPSKVAPPKKAPSRALPPPPPEADRRAFAAARRLILTRDLEQIRRGVESMAGDAALFEAFLSGCTADVGARFARLPEHERLSHTCRLVPDEFDELVPNPLLRYGRPLRPYREAALRALLAGAPPGSPTGAGLRADLRRLYCDGEGSAGSRHPVDLAPLAGLPHLDTLVLANVSTLTSQATLADLPHLATLALHRVHDEDLGALASPTVRELCLHSWTFGLDLRALPALRRLAIEGNQVVEEWSGPARLPDLTDVAVEYQWGPAFIEMIAASPLRRVRIGHLQDRPSALAPLAGTPTLSRLELGHVWSADLTIVCELRSVRSLTLTDVRGNNNLGRLVELPHLEELSIEVSALDAADLAPLAAAPALTRLVLDGWTTVAGTLPPRLEAITVRE